jgi:cytidylate kinase
VLDEAESNWVREVIVETLPEGAVNLDTYVHHLGRLLRLLALHGHVVLVGRGAHLFLPRDRGLAVRVVATEADRIDWTSRKHETDREAARNRIEEADRRRAGFIRHYFNRDADDPLLYDLIINASLMSTDELVGAVVDACRRRGLDSPTEP